MHVNFAGLNEKYRKKKTLEGEGQPVLTPRNTPSACGTVIVRLSESLRLCQMGNDVQEGFFQALFDHLTSTPDEVRLLWMRLH